MRRFQVGMFLALAVMFVGVGAAATPRHGPTLRIVTLGSGRVTCANGCSGAHRRGEVLRLTDYPTRHARELDAITCAGAPPALAKSSILQFFAW